MPGRNKARTKALVTGCLWLFSSPVDREAASQIGMAGNPAATLIVGKGKNLEKVMLGTQHQETFPRNMAVLRLNYLGLQIKISNHLARLRNGPAFYGARSAKVR